MKRTSERVCVFFVLTFRDKKTTGFAGMYKEKL